MFMKMLLLYLSQLFGKNSKYWLRNPGTL